MEDAIVIKAQQVRISHDDLLSAVSKHLKKIDFNPGWWDDDGGFNNLLSDTELALERHEIVYTTAVKDAATYLLLVTRFNEKIQVIYTSVEQTLNGILYHDLEYIGNGDEFACIIDADESFDAGLTCKNLLMLFSFFGPEEMVDEIKKLVNHAWDPDAVTEQREEVPAQEAPASEETVEVIANAFKCKPSRERFNKLAIGATVIVVAGLGYLGYRYFKSR